MRSVTATSPSSARTDRGLRGGLERTRRREGAGGGDQVSAIWGSRWPATSWPRGFPFAVHNRTRAKAEPLAAGGAAVAASAAEAAERARIVITMLADDQAIETPAEAFALVEKAGLDRLAVLETLNGALFASPVYQTNGDG